MNPGGLDSSDPELNPGTVSGSQAACTGRERERREKGGQGAQRKNGDEYFSVPLKTELGEAGHHPKASGPTEVPSFLPTQVGTMYS